MRGRFDRARSLLEPALDQAGAEGDAPGKARLQAELALVLAEESFYSRSGADRGLQLAQSAQASAGALGLAGVEARAVHADPSGTLGVRADFEALSADVRQHRYRHRQRTGQPCESLGAPDRPTVPPPVRHAAAADTHRASPTRLRARFGQL